MDAVCRAAVSQLARTRQRVSDSLAELQFNNLLAMHATPNTNARKRYFICMKIVSKPLIVQELCESRGGRPGLSVLTNLMVSVDVKQY